MRNVSIWVGLALCVISGAYLLPFAGAKLTADTSGDMVIRRIQSPDAQVRKGAKTEILQIYEKLRHEVKEGEKISDIGRYREIVDDLIQIVRKKRKRYDEDDEKLLAVQLLGEMRAAKAVDVLLDNITFCPPQIIKEKTFETVYPCVHALVRIGKPSTQGILRRLGRRYDEKIVPMLHAYAIVVMRVEGKEAGKGLLEENLERARRTQANIGEMLQIFD